MFDLGMFFPFLSFSISDIINQCLMAEDNLLTLQTHFLFKHAIWKQIFFCLPQGINFHIDFMVISSKCHILPYKQYLAKTEDEFSGKTQWRNWITILRSFWSRCVYAILSTKNSNEYPPPTFSSRLVFWKGGVWVNERYRICQSMQIWSLKFNVALNMKCNI